MPSVSPVQLSTSRPHWCLAADVEVEVDGVWGGMPDPTNPNLEPALYVSLPVHKKASQNYPAGGNEVFVDGSARWINIADMRFLTTFRKADRMFYFFQDPMDFPPKLQQHINDGNMLPIPN